MAGRTTLRERTEQIRGEEAVLREGGGAAGRERQTRLGRLFVRDRIAKLIDPNSKFFEIGLWAGYKMYPDWGDTPAAGVVAGIGSIEGRDCMIVANDATVKAGAFFPATAKKLLRAQRIAMENSLPTIYLVDSAGIFLPLQDEIFPDEDDFGRVFRNNSVMSAMGVPQFAAIMGNCVAGGAYLPVLSDKLLMTEGSGLYLAGPALVKAAIGQQVDAETLGGAVTHAEISGTVDFKERDDESCLARLRTLVGMLPADVDDRRSDSTKRPESSPDGLYDLVPADGVGEYDVRDVMKRIVDADSIEEFKADYGRTIVTAFARIGGRPVGVVANQKKRVKTAKGELQLGGVIYVDSSDKAARFILDCNQMKLPIIFLQDVSGFMVGRDSEHAGIIRSGAKLVNAVSNCQTPKLTVVIGGSFGAGNYAMCGKAFDPRFIFAWPNARYAVMGAEQAAETLFQVVQKAKQKAGEFDADEVARLRDSVKEDYRKQTDIRYGAARGWVDAIIDPAETRDVLIDALRFASRPQATPNVKMGVFQV
jgi:acetyl-CoA carboxylase carboxyltransferase component